MSSEGRNACPRSVHRGWLTRLEAGEDCCGEVRRLHDELVAVAAAQSVVLSDECGGQACYRRLTLRSTPVHVYSLVSSVDNPLTGRCKKDTHKQPPRAGAN